MALLRLQSGCGIMNQTNGAHHPVLGVEASGNAMSYSNSTFQTAATVPLTRSPAVAISSPSQPQPRFPASQADHHAYHQVQHFHCQKQQQQLQAFWANQMREIEQTTDFKNPLIPLARIKKIMKADEDVRMISAEAPVIFAKACKIFILELTLRSWIHTEENKRRTMQKNDIAAAISRTDVFDFLVDIIPGDELKEEGLGVTKTTIPFVGSSAGSISYYYPVGPPGFMVEKPLDQASICPVQQPQPSLSFMPGPQLQPQPQPSQSQKRW